MGRHVQAFHGQQDCELPREPQGGWPISTSAVQESSSTATSNPPTFSSTTNPSPTSLTSASTASSASPATTPPPPAASSAVPSPTSSPSKPTAPTTTAPRRPEPPAAAPPRNGTFTPSESWSSNYSPESRRSSRRTRQLRWRFQIWWGGSEKDLKKRSHCRIWSTRPCYKKYMPRERCSPYSTWRSPVQRATRKCGRGWKRCRRVSTGLDREKWFTKVAAIVVPVQAVAVLANCDVYLQEPIIWGSNFSQSGAVCEQGKPDLCWVKICPWGWAFSLCILYLFLFLFFSHYCVICFCFTFCSGEWGE